ncbi:hypothetical protein Tco_0574157 [Tanacetum coccineum]
MGLTTRSAVKKKLEKSEKIGSTPLRRSESGKNPVDVPASNVKFAVKKKPEKSEKIGSTPLRRSERGKNPVDVPALNVKACYKPQQVRVETDSGGNKIDKFDDEWDEKKKTIVNDFSLEKTLIRNRYGSNSSVRSEKLYLVEKEFADKLNEHERLRQVYFNDLKAKLKADVGQVVVNDVAQ